ncbi:MAG TPA: CAP domain-containing protein [Planctomycetota bacterium]
MDVQAPDSSSQSDVSVSPPPFRRPAPWRKVAGKLVPLVVVAVLLTVGTYLLSGGVRSELNSLAQLRHSGQLERAAAAIERLRGEWAQAKDDRLARLELEHEALVAVEKDKERLTKAIFDADSTKGYTYWKRVLEKLLDEGTSSEQIAARCLLADLSEVMLRRPKTVITPLPRDAVADTPAQPTYQPGKLPALDPVAARPQPAASRATTDRAAANAAEAQRLAGQGLFAQALALLQAAQAEAQDADAAKSAQAGIDELRTRAKAALQAVIEEARTAAAKKPADAVSLLEAARHRFPISSEFSSLGMELGKARELAAAAARKAAAESGGVDESVRIATLASVRVQMDKVRMAEERGGFAEAAGLLREAAALVREKDADFSTRLVSRAEEAELLAAWHDSVAAVLKTGRKLTTTVRTGQSVELRDTEGPVLLTSATEGPARLTWNDIGPEGVHSLAEQSAAAGKAVLGAAMLLYRQDDNARAEAWLAKALRADASLKPAIDRVLARGRGEPLDPLGYQLGKDGFVSGRSIDVEKKAQKLGGRLSQALRDKNPAARDALVAEIRASGPEAVAVMVAAFQKEFGQQIDKLQASSLRKQIDRLAEQRALLDRARQQARDLIYDEVKYFYPFKPPAVSGKRYSEYLEVQAEVDRRVEALRTLWEDQRLRVRVPASLRADLDRLDFVARVLAQCGELDQASLARADWARAVPAGETIGIGDYCANPSERAELEEWRHVEAYNDVIGKQLSSAVREQLKITNDYRAMFRHRPLALVRAVCDAAQGHAEEMSRLGYFSHTSPTPGRSNPYDRMKLHGYTFGVSENIALVDSAQGAHNQWYNSSGHHRNLLDPGHREAGIGADGKYWVQNFGSGNAHQDDAAWSSSGGTSR